MKILIIDNWEDKVGEMTSQYTAGVTYEMDEETAGRAAKAKATHDPAARALVKLKPLKPKKGDVDHAAELKKVTAELAVAKNDLASAGETFKKMEAQIAELVKERDEANAALAKAVKPQA